MSNAQGFAAMRTHIARLRELGTLVQDAAPDVAQAARAEVVAQAKRQEGPDGKPWAPTQSGKPALLNIAKELSVRAIRSTVVMTLDGVYARHNFGAVRGKVKREILPTKRIPNAMTRAIGRVVERRFRQTLMGGR